jgi:pimeloyl-ACP methyl ester carboxylesterase
MTFAEGSFGQPYDIDLPRGDRGLRARVAGSETGPLVIYHHGSPSSRLDIDYLHERSARRGVRLAAFDRPGFGGSSPQRFDLRSIAADAAALADHLGATEFRVMGQSSGVAYAVATAAVLRDRVAALGTGGGGSPFEPDIDGWDHLSEDEQRGVQLIGSDDARAEKLLSDADAGTFEMLKLDDAGIEDAWANIFGPADGRVLAQGLGPLVVRSMRESLRQGRPGGWARDNVVRMGPWDVNPSDATCPATFWVGEEDRGNIGPAQWLKSRIPHGDLRILPGHGHLVIFELWDEVLEALGL